MTAAESIRLSLNMITSLDGAISYHNRGSNLSCDVDRDRMHRLRRDADLVIVGSRTATSGRYWRDDFLRRHNAAGLPRIGVVSTSRWIAGEDVPHTLITTTTNVDANAELVIKAGGAIVDWPTALARMQELGYRNVLLEGGPTTLSGVASAVPINDLHLTIAPYLIGGKAERVICTHREDLSRYRLLNHQQVDDYIFLDFTRKSSCPTPS
ncbi:dihydrofolate reductase family protein [Microlunatus soli]|uniref:RibD C-terminal domain-containing protein n=1 Tax=Microlunatus soli TaxID=630515 RepID=A0A1H1S997_9ACTN|nr:dihydrofolate reductase family protein [Microlunatus soli]SDS44557.1 RibD C-terminal domain-containing protein [Microlunatus soli]